MPAVIDYYLAPQSPWTYLGHDRFRRIAEAAGANVKVMPVDLGKVFPVSGGLPLGQRAPQRQAYRLVELARFRDALQLPLNIKPRYFPVPGDQSARLIIAVDQADGSAPAMRLAGAVLAAVWAQERNIDDAATLAQLLAECDLPASRADAAKAPEVQALYERYTQQAIDAGVFGAPSYVIDGEIFWGQDRLDLVQRRLQQHGQKRSPASP
jgi:2-hydroxychromene-2-carboxylate isomerase